MSQNWKSSEEMYRKGWKKKKKKTIQLKGSKMFGKNIVYNVVEDKIRI